jgi:transposase
MAFFISFEEELTRMNLHYCLDELQSVRDRIKDILKALRSRARKPPIQHIVFDYLMSVPGVGFITAMTFYSEIVDMHRFPSFDKLATFVGLVPDVDSSGERETTMGLTFRQNKYLRHMLIESAWFAVRLDPAMTLKFSLLTKRMKKQQAIIRIAKKLLSRMRYVWLNEKIYVNAIVS